MLVNRLRDLMRVLPGGDAEDAEFDRWGRDFVVTVVCGIVGSIIGY